MGAPKAEEQQSDGLGRKRLRGGDGHFPLRVGVHSATDFLGDQRPHHVDYADGEQAMLLAQLQRREDVLGLARLRNEDGPALLLRNVVLSELGRLDASHRVEAAQHLYVLSRE